MTTASKRLLVPLALLCCAGTTSAQKPGAPSPPLLQRVLNGPTQANGELIFCTRSRYDDGHWYANIGYYCDDASKPAYPGNGKPDVSKLFKLDLRSGKTTVLLDPKGGTIRDPKVHYDGQKVLFSYRKAGSHFFNLYEINVDGSGLKQLTSGEFDDYEPTYLPDGGIVFVSTRCKRWVNCWKTQVGIIYRCDADGGNIHAISANTEHDNTPWVLPDGRILYTRWEYVDRSQVEFHHLWTMNPDGTGQTVYFGNMHSWTVMIDAKPIPGTEEVLANFSPGHGANEHAGIATAVSVAQGPDAKSAARPLHKGGRIRDPYPLSKDYFLAARGKQIVLFSAAGKSQVVYTHPGEGEVHEPRPLGQRKRERIIPSRTTAKSPTGTMILSDVYNGRNMTGVKRGDIKSLLILESLPKPVNFSGGADLTSWLGTFTLERVLGKVPVEEDGSASFEVPALRQIFFVALDENDMSVKRMQSFATVMPGEIASCAGCHEDRAKPVPQLNLQTLQALKRPPSKIEAFSDHPDVMDFQRDIQPILDRHCVECHDYKEREGDVVLEGDLGPHYSHSYFSLLAHKQVADGRNGLGNQPPRSLGTSASELMDKIDGWHHNVELSPKEWRTVWLWIESGAPFAGSYAALRNAADQGTANRAAGEVFGRGREVLNRRCASCHARPPGGKVNVRNIPFDYNLRKKNRHLIGRPTAAHERLVIDNDPMARFSSHILVNFTRPQLSPLLLGPLSKKAGGYGSCGEVFKNTEDPDYRILLDALQKGKAHFDAKPRYGQPGFKPNPQYIREMKKYGVLGTDADASAIDTFATDQAYWKSLWYQPPSS